eukprot:TRINITY_DN832_c3_g1_i1.p1 TRINITY_DN832_c3_g1~~TRINITY_DN832_c3_g1_i1.p1  ORF type:complete len:550 (-),score=62.57 TRINITY_DN832_c3_g1_i1:173-1789(-)
MHLLDLRLICFGIALVGFARGQSCSTDDYRLSLEGTTAFSVSKDDLVCRCPAGIETNGAVRAASFEVSGANQTGQTALQNQVAALTTVTAALTAELAAEKAKVAALTTTCASGSAVTAIGADGRTTCSSVPAAGGSGVSFCDLFAVMTATVIYNSDLALIEPCVSLRALYISGPEIVGPIRLPNLQRVDTVLSVTNTVNVTELDFPVLVTSGSVSMDKNPALRVIRLPAFEKVISSDFSVSYNSALVALHLPSVRSPGYAWSITDNRKMATLALDSLTAPTGSWKIMGASLTELNLPNLSSAAINWNIESTGVRKLLMPLLYYAPTLWLTIDEPALVTLDLPITSIALWTSWYIHGFQGLALPGLTSVLGTLTVGCYGNTSFSLPRLVSAGLLTIEYGVLDAPVLDRAGKLRIIGSAAGALVPQLTFVGNVTPGAWYSSGLSVNAAKQLDSPLVFPSLRVVQDLSVTSSLLPSMSFPALTHIYSQVSVTDNMALSVFSTPVLASAPYSEILNNRKLCVNGTLWRSVSSSAYISGNLCN